MDNMWRIFAVMGQKREELLGNNGGCKVSNTVSVYWRSWILDLSGEGMLPSGGFLLPRRLVSSVFIFVLIFYAFRSSLIISPFNPAFPDLELAHILWCLAYIIFLTPSVPFQGFGLFIIESPFNCLPTHGPSTILFLFVFISYISSSLSPVPSPQEWKV